MMNQSTQSIRLARKHVGDNVVNESSARFCLNDALRAFERDDYRTAHMWAVKSLAYSVGIFHRDYQSVA